MFWLLGGQLIATAAFLIGYWALKMFVPVPGHEWGVLKPAFLSKQYPQTCICS